MSKASSAINFSIEISSESMVITHIPSGSIYTTFVGKKEKNAPRKLYSTMQNVEKGSKNHQYGYYINKFVRVLVGKHTSNKLTYKARFEKIAKKFSEVLNSPSVRAFSSNIRKVTNDGTLFPINMYFHEGKMKAIPEVDTIEETVAIPEENIESIMAYVQENDTAVVEIEELELAA